jgi:predicted phage tail protein
MLTEIKLYGHLKETTGSSSFKAKVNNTAEAVKFLIANFPTLEHEMANQYYKVSVNNVDIGKTELHDPIGLAEIKIIPVIAGSGRGFGKILLGAALIGLSFISFGGAPGLGAAFSGGKFVGLGKVGMVSKSLAYIGAALVLSGISDLFTPEIRPDAEDPLSANFSNAINTTLATVPIPILYGEYIVGSVVISAGIETADGSPTTSNSSVAQDHRGNTTNLTIDENTGEPLEEYDRDNTDTSLRRYVRIYSVSSVKVKIEAVVGNNTYQGTGYTNTGDELLTAYREQNKNQFNYSAFVRNGTTKYFPGNLKESIGTFDANNRPSTGANDGYYYGLVTGTAN